MGVAQVLGVPPFAPDADGAAARTGGIQERRGECEQEGALRQTRIYEHCRRYLVLRKVPCGDAGKLCTEDVFMWAKSDSVLETEPGYVPSAGAACASLRFSAHSFARARRAAFT